VKGVTNIRREDIVSLSITTDDGSSVWLLRFVYIMLIDLCNNSFSVIVWVCACVCVL